MANCKECMHYKVCAKEGRLTQIDEHTWDYFNELDNVEKFCDNYISTADVVPKSEVEKLQAKIDEFKKDRYQILPDGRIELLPRTDVDKIKSDLAREIFEEIEKYMVVFGDTNLSTYFRGIGWKVFAELKKKYTEEQNK